MEEVKMVLDVPTLATLREQQGVTDDEWQMWYGRELCTQSLELYSGIVQPESGFANDLTIQKGEDGNTHSPV